MTIKSIFKGRLPRGSYFLFLISLGFLQEAGRIFYGYDHRKSNSSPDIFTEILYILFFIVLIILILSVNTRRWHDLGKSGYFSLLSLIPYLNLFIFAYLTFKKGRPTKNPYGPPPQKINF